MSTSFEHFLAQAIAARGRPAWSTSPVVVQSALPGRAVIDGTERLLLCTNDYLGLACDPRVVMAAHEALDRLGAGSRAARSLAGDSDVHRTLEAELAAFKGAEAALLFGSGFACNVGVIPALAERDDVIHSDAVNHASIVDGCRLAAADLRIYPHVDTRALAGALVESQRAVKQMIVTDAVFSMDGDVAPVADIVRLAETHDAFVVVDDAHATGVLGANGKGSLEHFGVRSDAVVMMGTLGKALGSIGGFIAGTQDLIDYLAGSARSFLFTTALPAPAAASALTSLRILRAEPERVARLWENARFLHAGLAERGFRVAGEAAAIIPVYLDDERAAVELSEMLYDSGVVVQPIGPPYVPAGTSRLRVIASAAHSAQDLEIALEAFQRASKASVARA